MKFFIFLIAFFFVFTPSQTFSQELDCEVAFTNIEILPAEARDNLTDYIIQVQQYLNDHRWTPEGLGGQRIKCTFNISFLGAPRDNRYTVQVFVGSQRPIFRMDRNTAVVRILDESWEFDYFRNQPFIHDEQRYDPLLSFFDFYAYVILGLDFETYKTGDGTPFFQKALEIVNRARSGIGRGWETSGQTGFSRGRLVDELMNPKFREFRSAFYRYHYKGLDLLPTDEMRARKNMLAALEKISNLQEKINQRSLIIQTFFDTKYLEIAEVFRTDPDPEIYSRLSKIDPSHQKTYDEYRDKGR